MTVQPISDEQLAEVERLISQREPSYENRKIMNATISAIIARLRAAEVDAKRYRWLRNPDQDVSLVLDKVSGEVPADEFGCGGYLAYEYRSGDELDAAIDAAMERTP
ncbi:hypothetical protein [Pseudomonas aeruginosa]|uniref:hypothetical protein n=1 Tax=Pseudomonas aeruginosa TaxID=287 RepID=UPI0013258311|nr:hypothetical protein [Pseudomonas aeruginosa]MWV92224.1 hypothetical protein [Pseudomonas aeruginosa]MWW68567.1 hypothetical protein [Pseudomonas aeruginosa]